MCKVILSSVCHKIRFYVLEGSERTPVIKRTSPVWNKNQQGSPWLQHAFPFLKRPQRICDVLQYVGSHNEIVGRVGYYLELTSVSGFRPSPVGSTRMRARSSLASSPAIVALAVCFEDPPASTLRLLAPAIT